MLGSKQTKNGRQQAELFRLKFQSSKTCKFFRIRWYLPANGFKNRQEYYEWNNKLSREANDYNKSEKYKKNKKMIDKMKIDCAKGKITSFGLELFAHNIGLNNPLHKLEYDISNIVLKSGKPIYWRDFIEQCLFFENPDICFPDRPLPKPSLRWNSLYQFNELIIENIFPDTGTKDFDDKRFTRKLEELKKKIPGNSEYKQRYKRNLDEGLNDLGLSKNPTSSDTDNNLWITKSRKVTNSAKQIRSRTRKYIDRNG